MHSYYEAWTEFASCREIDPELWYPEKGGSVKDPVSVCHRCPVRLQCLEKAMQDELGHGRPYREGIWGGLSPSKRHKYEAEWLAQQAEVTAA